MPDNLIPLNRANELLPVPVRYETLSKWCRNGRLAYTRVGARIYVAPQDLAKMAQHFPAKTDEFATRNPHGMDG